MKSPIVTPTLRYRIQTTFDFDMGLFLKETPKEDLDKVVVFRGDGEYHNDTAAPDSAVIKVVFPKEKEETRARFLHAKITLSSYEDGSFILAVGSRNISAYDNVEADLIFVGKISSERQEGNGSLLRLLEELLPYVDAERRKALLGKALEDLPFVYFHPLQEGEGYLQHLAATAASVTLHGPVCTRLPLFEEDYDEALLISPFITPDVLLNIKQRLPENAHPIIMTTPDVTEALLHDGFLEERYLFLEIEKFVHAKLFLTRKGSLYDLYLGSMNLTDYAVNKNLEMMVGIHGVPVQGIAEFLAGFLGLPKENVEGALSQFSPRANDDFLSSAIDFPTRRDYYLSLHHNQKLKGESDLVALRYLFSKNFAKNVESLLKSPSFELIPTRKVAKNLKKERVVYSLSTFDQLNLGLINFALHRYDDMFSKNAYLHVKGRGIKDVFLRIRNDPSFTSYYILRTDIHAFDPSMEEEFLLKAVQKTYGFDRALCDFLCHYIEAKDYQNEGDETIYHDGPAQWTGMPLAGVLENVYLDDFDKAIESTCPFYARCGDDILIGVESKAKAEELLHLIEEKMEERHLSLSSSKTFVLAPGDPFSFLGFQIENGEIDLSPAFLQKAKQGIYQQRKSLLRYYSKKGIPSTLRLPSLVRYTNALIRKFDIIGHFKVITTTKSLKVIDDLILDMMRIVVTGKKGKEKFSLTMKDLHLFGYRSLVNSYYRYINRNEGEAA